MPPTTASLLRASRPIFRSQFFTTRTQASQISTGFTRSQFRAAAGRRFQSTASEAPQVGWFKRMWDSPIGLKTVHFWAPVMKWSLVLAGISDFYRPADKLSLTQNLALTATGIIWTRWCLIIKPRNILLAAVNFFLGIVGVVQVSRILLWRRTPEGKAALQLEAAKAKVTQVKA